MMNEVNELDGKEKKGWNRMEKKGWNGKNGLVKKGWDGKEKKEVVLLSELKACLSFDLLPRTGHSSFFISFMMKF